MSMTWYAVACWAPLSVWALTERFGRKSAESDRDYLRDTRWKYREHANAAVARMEEVCETQRKLRREMRRVVRQNRAMVAVALGTEAVRASVVLAVDQRSEAECLLGSPPQTSQRTRDA